MFRCDNCGSGYSVRSASSFESCPRCLAKGVNSPLAFELGWRGSSNGPSGGGEVELPDNLPLTRRPLGQDAEVEVG